MTEADLRSLLTAYVGLVDKAKIIISGPPYFTTCDEEFGDLDIVDDDAVLYWPEWAAGYYNGDGNIERQSVQFPLSLLLLSNEDLAEWKAEQKRAYEEKEAAKKAAAIALANRQREASERQTYEYLKAKYDSEQVQK